jgi:hypothetical protein
VGASGKLDLDLIRKMASAQGAFLLPYTRRDKQGRAWGANLDITYEYSL